MNIKIREVKIEDAKEIQKIYEPYVIKEAISFELVAPNTEEMKNRIKKIIEQGYPYIVAVNEDNKVLGYAYATKYHEREAYKYTCSLSIYIDENIHTKGIGQLLYNQLEKILKEKKILQIISLVVEKNEKSINFHIKNGFEEIGYLENAGYKFNKWYGVHTLKKVINDINKITK